MRLQEYTPDCRSYDRHDAHRPGLQLPEMSDLWALAVFSFVAAATPGPNNIMLWASGVQFGLRPTLPHLTGVVLGVGSMAVAVAAGIGVLLEAVPQLELGLKVIGSIYLLYLAFQVAGIGPVQQNNVARPLWLWQAVAFQYVNPKAWVFVVAAFTTFRPDDLPLFLGAALMVLTIMAVVFPSALIWAAGGTFLSQLLAGRGSRLLSVTLGLLLAATVVYIWL